LFGAIIAVVLIVVILLSLVFSGIIPLLSKPSPSPSTSPYSTFTPSPTLTPLPTSTLSPTSTPTPTSSPSIYPETAKIKGLLATDGTLITNGATTNEKVLTLKGNVTNPEPVAPSPNYSSASFTGNSQITLASTQIRPVQSDITRVFHGHVVLVLSTSERYLNVVPLSDSGGVDLWEFEGKVVLANGPNTFHIDVLNDNNETVGQSLTFTVISTVPLTDLRVTLNWDTDYSDLDLHVWHLPYIQLGTAGGKDGNGGWWQWYGQWQNQAETSPWIPEANPSDSDNYLNIESFTWRSYSYIYNQQQYNYGDGVGHAWYLNQTGITEANIDVDKKDGYGPEIFTMSNVRPGLYTVVARMYSPHESNTTTTATVTVELPQNVKTFTHQFEPVSHGDSVVQYPPTYETHEGDFPQATVTDWVAYSFYVLPDKTVVTPVENDMQFTADCSTSSTGGYFRDRWFLLDHATPISSVTAGWVTGTQGIFTLERLGEEFGGELIIKIAIGGVGYQPGGVWQGVTQNIPPGIYRLSAGNAVEGPNSLNIVAKIIDSP
jgi:hypothetical protein